MLVEAWELLASIAGATLILAVVLDVILSILHPDIEGPLAHCVQRLSWALFRIPAVRRPGIGRSLLAAGGPAMIVATFVTWIIGFIVGFALVYWPHMAGEFGADRDLVEGSLGFVDALYFSGITGTVLGYGDLVPSSGALKTLAWVQSGLGFAMLTAIVAYLLSVLGGLGARNTLALRLHHERREGQDGTALLIDWIGHEQMSSVERRIDELAADLAAVQERLHRFPLVSLHYRSVHGFQDPEPALERLTEVAIAAGLLAGHEEYGGLGPSARRLRRALADGAELLARQHVDADVADLIRAPEPTEAERKLLAEIAGRLAQGLGTKTRPEDPSDDLLRLAFQMRVFLDGLDEQTLWRRLG